MLDTGDDILTMNHTELRDLVINTIIPNGDALIVEGPPGCGKTEGLFELANILQDGDADFGSCYHNFGGAELMHAIGTPKNSDNRFSLTGVPPWAMPYPRHTLRGVYRNIYDKKGHDLHTLNATTALAPYPTGLAIMDEVQTSPDGSLRLAFAQFWCDSRFGDWELPEGWGKVGLTNNLSHRSAVKPMLMHARNRVMIARLRPTVQEHIEHWRKIGLRQEFILFAKAMPDLVLSQSVPTEDVQWSTARSWTKAEGSATLWMQNKLGLDPNNDPLPMGDKMFLLCIASRVGMTVLNEFRSFMTDMTALPTYEECVAAPGTVRLPSDPAKQQLLVNMLSHSAEFADLQKIITCVSRLPKPIAGIWGAEVAKRFGSSASRHSWFLDFLDHCGTGAKLQIHVG